MARQAPTTEIEELEEIRRELEALRAQVAALESGALKDSAVPLSSLFEGLSQLPVLLFRVDAEGRFRYVTGRAMERVGLDSATMVGRHVLDFFPEAATEVLESLAGNAVRSESSGILDGRPWAAMSYVVPVDEDGGTVGVSLDITDWKIARKELAASESRFRSLAETVAVAITRNDLFGFIVYANEPMGRLLGRAPADLVGHNSLEFAHEDDRARITEEWITCQQSGRAFSGVFRVHGADGRIVWVLSRSEPELDESGNVTGYVASLVDITERKHMEEELSRRVAERTAALVQANRELEAFCYSVSHDLRAPLRTIDGFCRLLGEDVGTSISPSGRDHLDRVLAATSRMDSLIDDFLTLSRASLGAVARVPVDLTSIARRIADELAQYHPDRSVRFEIADGLVAEGDPSLLRDALENLLGNAFKFTARAAAPCVELFATTAASGEKAFVVRDNGIGFDMQLASKLFTAFHRLHEEFEGTGVGLATVDRIIRRHGGRVWAESAHGKGASFFFTLP